MVWYACMVYSAGMVCVVVFRGVVWYDRVWCGLMWYGVVWYGMAWFLYGMEWYGMVWYGTVRYRKGALTTQQVSRFSNMPLGY